MNTPVSNAVTCTDDLIKDDKWCATIEDTYENICPNCGCDIWDVVNVGLRGVYVCDNCLKPENF